MIEEGASGTKPLSEWLAAKEFLSKLDRMFRSALDPLTVFKAFQEKAGRFTASASRAVVEARGFLRAAFSNPVLKTGLQRRERPGFGYANGVFFRKTPIEQSIAGIFHYLPGDV